MKPPPNPWDFHRLLVGESPWWSLLEVLARAALIYFLLMLFMRLMGKRVANQMSVSELAVVVTLGAAVGVPMQVQDRGMLPAILILLVALAFQRGMNFWAFRSRRVELVTQGDVTALVVDGRLLLDEMRRNVLSRERLFSVLRTLGISELGEVRRAYLEATGQISLFRHDPPLPGLSILPAEDDELLFDAADDDQLRTCASCGALCSSPRRCERCHGDAWKRAVRPAGRANTPEPVTADSPAADTHFAKRALQRARTDARAPTSDVSGVAHAAPRQRAQDAASCPVPTHPVDSAARGRGRGA
jgi:uncharacterized membrane protein YcaP (DUF421 family)